MPDAQFVSDLADQAVMLPLALGLAVLFAAAGWWRGAIGWTTAIGGTLAAMLGLKLLGLACGHLLPGMNVLNPSGHTAAAGAIYGGLLAIVGRRVSDSSRWTIAWPVLAAVVIGGSRLALGVHSAVEVVLGGVVGVCGAIVAVRMAGAPPRSVRLSRIGAMTVVVLIVLHGIRMPAEPAIRTLALKLWPLSACR